MTERIRWGILGTGRIAKEFATGLQEVEDAELIAVGSRAAVSAKEFAEQYEAPKYYANYPALAGDPDVDVVYIATPHAMHRENAIMCLESGKAVLCEKPFTINADEAKAVIDLARTKKLFIMEAMWTRYFPAVVKLRELLAENIIGDVQIMLAGGAFIPEFDPEFYLFNRNLGGGVLLDAGVYLVSMSSMIFGPPNKIVATAELGETGVDEHDAFVLGHTNGAIASLYVSLRAKSSPDVTLLGNKGKIHLHAPIFCPSKLTVTVTGESENVIDLPFASNGFQFEAMEVNRCLRERRTESAIMPLHETLSIMETMDRIREQIGLTYPME